MLWIFAIGQFGWSLLSGIISNWLVYYYTDSQAGVFGKNITGGTLFLSITLFGLITMVGRIFDAVTDPMIAGWSGPKQLQGRQTPTFMKVIAVPFAVMTACVFVLPQTSNVLLNDIIIFVTLMLFYLFMTIYCTPYNALISELGDTQKKQSERFNVHLVHIYRGTFRFLSYTEPCADARRRTDDREINKTCDRNNVPCRGDRHAYTPLWIKRKRLHQIEPVKTKSIPLALQNVQEPSVCALCAFRYNILFSR